MFRIVPVLLLFSLPTLAQDWAPFPLGQKGYYTNEGKLTGSNRVRTILMDSIESFGNQQVLRFGQHLDLAQAGNCAPEDSLQQTFAYGYPKLVESLTWADDTIWYEPHVSLGQQVFLVPQAEVGGQWGMRLGGLTSHDSAYITCSGMEERTFFGITDSVRIFDIETNYDRPTDGLQMVLSKHYGLLEYVENYHAYWYGKIGFEQNGQTFGYSPPAIEDYLIYAPGDVLLWDYQLIFHPGFGPDSLEWYRDSITAVQNQGDTFRYSFDRTILRQEGAIESQPNQERVFPLTHFRALTEAHLGWVGLSNNFVGSGASADEILVWRDAGHYRVSEPGATTWKNTIAVFNTNHTVLDRSDCSLSFNAEFQSGLNLSTSSGVINYFNWHSASSVRYEKWALIGGRFSGVQQGNIHLPVGIQEPGQQSISVYPNPTKGLVRLDFPTSGSEPLTFRVHAMTGQVVLQGTLQHTTLDLSQLPGGIYWLDVQSQDHHYHSKLLKTD